VRQFELVGLLIEGRLFDPALFLRSWHHSIARCWQACEPLVRHQRSTQQEPGFGRYFEELQVLARECTTDVRPRLGYDPASVSDSASGQRAGK